MTQNSRGSRGRPAPRGLTLLEVLVACGILVLGLAGIAGLLPAASSQLSQAATEDRAGVLSSNAASEVINRRLASADLGNDVKKAIGFGKAFSELATVSPAWFAAPTAAQAVRIDANRGFLLEDALVYSANATGFLANTFTNGSSGPREFQGKVCWGAALLPGLDASGSAMADAASGSPVTLAIATLRRQPDAGRALRSFTLHAPAIENPVNSSRFFPPAGAFVMTPRDLHSAAAQRTEPIAVRTQQENDRKTFLATCSAVFLLPIQPGSRPIRLLPVNSSWTVRGPGTSEDVTRRSSQVVLRLPEALLTVYADHTTAFDPYRRVVTDGSVASGHRQEILVIGIANLVRMDQYYLTLD